VAVISEVVFAVFGAGGWILWPMTVAQKSIVAKRAMKMSKAPAGAKGRLCQQKFYGEPTAAWVALVRRASALRRDKGQTVGLTVQGVSSQEFIRREGSRVPTCI